MIIEYDIHCFERTLKITIPDKDLHREDEILEILDEHYDYWHSAEYIEDEEERLVVMDSCLEEFIMEGLSKTYNGWLEWDTEYYSDDEEDMYETIPVKNVKEEM